MKSANKNGFTLIELSNYHGNPRRLSCRGGSKAGKYD